MQSLWMILASLSFASMGVCVKLATVAGHFSIAEVVFYRSFIALIFMYALLRWRGIPARTSLWRFHIQRSVSGFVSLVFYFYAISMLPLATAVTLSYTSPLFLAVYLAVLGKARLHGGIVFALVLGFAGVVFLLKPTFQAEQLLGGSLGLAGAMVAGLAYFNVKELGDRGEAEERIVFYFVLVSTIGSVLWMTAFEFHALDGQGVLLLLVLGATGTLGQLAMTRAYKRGKTLVSASLAYSTVIFASFFGMLIWNETLSLGAWLAIALIVASGIIASWFSRANPADQD